MSFAMKCVKMKTFLILVFAVSMVYGQFGLRDSFLEMGEKLNKRIRNLIETRQIEMPDIPGIVQCFMNYNSALPRAILRDRIPKAFGELCYCLGKIMTDYILEGKTTQSGGCSFPAIPGVPQGVPGLPQSGTNGNSNFGLPCNIPGLTQTGTNGINIPGFPQTGTNGVGIPGFPQTGTNNGGIPGFPGGIPGLPGGIPGLPQDPNNAGRFPGNFPNIGDLGKQLVTVVIPRALGIDDCTEDLQEALQSAVTKFDINLAYKTFCTCSGRVMMELVKSQFPGLTRGLQSLDQFFPENPSQTSGQNQGQNPGA